MMRLGLRLTGRNVDLGPAPSKSEEDSGGEGGTGTGEDNDADESDDAGGDSEVSDIDPDIDIEDLKGDSDLNEETLEDEDFDGLDSDADEDGEEPSEDADEPEAGNGAGEDDEDSDDPAEGSNEDEPGEPYAPKSDDPEGEGEDEGEGNDPDDVDDGHETELPDMPSDDDEDGPPGGGGGGDGDDAPEGNHKADESDADGSDDDPEGDTGEAGGHNEVDEAQAIAESLLDAMEDGIGSGLTDNNDALKDAVGDETDESDDMLSGEAPWRPLNPSLDEVKVVRANDASKAASERMKKSVRKVVSSLSAKLRSKFLQARTKRTLHGVPVGEGLSGRRLVDSMVEIRAGRRPKRPDYRTLRRPECSLAAAVVIDQSGSMGGMKVDAGRAAIALAEPLDRLGAPCLVIGPRNGGHGYNGYGGYGSYSDMYDDEGKRVFHRESGVLIDVFKDWDEPMTKALGRFGKVQACGSTPLSDGIQYALQSLSHRKEVYRVIYVITDGWPDNQDVVRRQIRIAAEQGVTVVGVGISSGCGAVKGLFPVHVAVPDLEELPRELLRVLDSIMFPRSSKRLKLDGPKFKKAQ
jgi:hypothetical protein